MAMMAAFSLSSGCPLFYLLILAVHGHLGVPMLDTEDTGRCRPCLPLGTPSGERGLLDWPPRRCADELVTLVLTESWGHPGEAMDQESLFDGETAALPPPPGPWSPVSLRSWRPQGTRVP